MPTRDRLQLIFLFYKVLRLDKWLLWYRWEDWLGSAQCCQIVYLKGTVGETSVIHYCFPSVKSDLFSYLVLATETNHALIYFPGFFFGYTAIWKAHSQWSIQLQTGTTPLKGWSHLNCFFISFSLLPSGYLKHQQEKYCCTSNYWK